MIYLKDCLTGDGHVINMRHISYVRIHDNQDHTADVLFYSVDDALLCVLKCIKDNKESLINYIRKGD